MRESTQALEAFTLYRDMGSERSTRAVGQRLGKSTDLMERWCSAHGWVERCRQHDQSIADAAAERDKAARLADADKRLKDRLKVASAVRGKGASALAIMTAEQLAKRPYAVVQMFDYADRTERLDSGEATSRNEVTGPDGGPLKAVVTHELRFDFDAFRALFAGTLDGAGRPTADGDGPP